MNQRLASLRQFVRTCQEKCLHFEVENGLCGIICRDPWSFMPDAFSIHPAHTAVLNLDCQSAIVSIYTKDDRDGFLQRAVGVLNHARAAHMNVIHVKVGFRPGLPELTSQNQLLGAIKASPQHQKLFEEPLGGIHPALMPTENEIVITKHRVSAFIGSDLAMILRANQLDTLILFGIATSGVVLSTLLEASDADFRLAVIKDCCADLDVSLHDALIQRLFPSRATVLSAAEFQAISESADLNSSQMWSFSRLIILDGRDAAAPEDEKGFR